MRSGIVEEEKCNRLCCENRLEMGKIEIGPHTAYKN